MSSKSAWKVLYPSLMLGLGVAAMIGCAPATEKQPAEVTVTLEAYASDALGQAAAVIDAERLRSHIAVLSADDMAGRGPGTAGDLKARTYIAEQMAAVGLEPAGVDGTWEQPFDIVGLTASVPDTWSFTGQGGDLSLDQTEEFIAFSGVQTDEASVENAELIFVGYGIEAPEYGWDDFKGVDVTGKVLVMLNNDPDWDDAIFEGDRRLYYGRWGYKYEQAAKHGAAGAIILFTQPSAGYPWGVVTSSWTGPQFELPAGDEPRIQVGAWTTEEATRELVALGGFDLDDLVEKARAIDFEPVPLGITTSLKLTTKIERTQTANVLGRLPGSHPDLADEIVLYGAHHDHLGANGEGEDKIFNGALDNAAGVSAVLAIAEAFQALPRQPARSVVFATWAAEEQGLLGSKHYANNPTYAPGKIAANINIDGGNIWGKTEDVAFIGLGKSSLDDVIKSLAAAQNRTVVGDQFPDRGFFYRSDQFNLAKIGVPAIYLDTGSSFVGREEGWGTAQIEAWEADLYHQVGDELDDSWNFDGMVDDTQLLFSAGVEIAEADVMPAWTKGDEFEAARLDALEAVDRSTTTTDEASP